MLRHVSLSGNYFHFVNDTVRMTHTAPAHKTPDAQSTLHREPRGTAPPEELLTQRELGLDDVIYWPSVVPVYRLLDTEARLGDYYLYYSASHTDSSIRMAYADDPLGTYTDHGPVFEDDAAGPQTETPEVIWNPDTERFHLYYHGFLGTAQSTALAFSTDGINWEKHGVVIDAPPNTPGNGHTGYARIHRLGDYWIAHHLLGGGGSSGFGVSYSSDGIMWRTDPRRLSNAKDLSGHPDRRIVWSHTNIVHRDGRYWWIGSVKGNPFGSGAGSGSSISWAPFVDERSLLGPTRELVDPNETHGVSFAYAPDVLVENGTVYLFYATRQGEIHVDAGGAQEGCIYGARIRWSDDTNGGNDASA
jgi:hypothetical protein